MAAFSATNYRLIEGAAFCQRRKSRASRRTCRCSTGGWTGCASVPRRGWPTRWPRRAAATRPCRSGTASRPRSPGGSSSSTPPSTGCASAGWTWTAASAGTSGGSESPTTRATTSSCWWTGVRRRRHIRTRLRRVVAVDDEVLDRHSPDAAEAGGPAGEAALLAALEASRTGRMADIVETIQAEQDRVIRSPHPGVLVVQGGAGTGKTAVALHRVAYLLYTHREQLSRRGVLVVGPNQTFLRYIGQVLPSLGETGVVLAPVGELVPGVTADRAEPPRVAEVKGRAELAGVVAAAVQDRQRVP